MHVTLPLRRFTVALVSFLCAVGAAAQEAAPPPLLITGARIFDGRGPDLIEGADVLVQDGLIARVAPEVVPPDGARVVQAEGRVLMPGLTDAHWHAAFASVSQLKAFTSDPGYMHAAAVAQAEATLRRGFTTVRDMGGPVMGLKQAIDEGVVPGPRLYPSGPMLSQTGGHGDFRLPGEFPTSSLAGSSVAERQGVAVIADGTDAVRRRARELLAMGATQIKAHAGGGVASRLDPLDVRQYSAEEMRAIIDAAEAWNTYVAVHAYTPQAIRMAVEAGVKSVEHGQLIDEETAMLMARNGAWLSIQPFLADEDANSYPQGSPSWIKQRLVAMGTANAIELAKRHGVNIALGTDVLYSPRSAARQGAQLAKFGRWFEPWEVLAMLTSGNQRLFKLSGPRDPYPGPNGVIEAGAHADLILVDGNPLEDLSLIGRPEEAFVLIIKGGATVKSTLD